jgi:hypothetical protein
MLLLLACTSGKVAPDPVTDSVETETLDGSDTGDPETLPGGTCDPGADPVYVDEGEEASFVVGCTGGGSADSFSMPDLPPGATFDGRLFTWTPGLSDAGHLELVVDSSGEYSDAGVVDVWVADAWSDPDNVEVDPATYEEELGLPVLHLEVPPDTNDTTDVATTLWYRGESYDIELKYRGAASAYYPKRSYTVSFPSDHEFDDGDWDFENRRKITVTSLFDDNSYLRQWLCYQLWSAADPKRHDVQSMFAVVYVNGAYVGLYVVTDHIDGEYWEDHGYDEDGSLYKAVDHRANFYSTYNGYAKSSWHDGYEKQEGDPEDFSDIDELVQFVAESPDDTFSDGIASRVVVDEIADWWILVRWTEADDSGGKNAYLYRDATTGLFHHAPWDFNHSLGQTWQTEREGADTNYDFYWSNNLFYRLIVDPVWGPVMADRMREQLDGVYAPDAVLARIDDVQDVIEPSAERDWEKWQDSYRSYGGWYWRTDWTTHDEEVAYLRAWVEARGGYMDTWFP